MKIGIYHQKGTFSDRWIAYCKGNDIPFKVVDCYQNDIIKQLEDCNALMWHHQQTNYKDVLLAKNLLFTLEQIGKVVFPNFNTGWHFDDKVAQKYLLESINTPLVPSYAFYDKKSALNWADQTSYPKVFKLKGGSGSDNVKLAKTKKEAVGLIKQAFGNGFSQLDAWEGLKERYREVREGKKTLNHLINGLGRLVIPTEYDKMHGKEKGYAYFQDFIPNNYSDIRIIVIGNKAFGLKRTVRTGDFRASGSGNIIYDKAELDLRCISIAFKVSKDIGSQCLAYDFVFDQDNNPLIVEISYGFSSTAYDDCEGYWDDSLVWHDKPVTPQEWMVDEVIQQLRE